MTGDDSFITATEANRANRTHIVISEHTNSDGQRYYRLSGAMSRDSCMERARRMIVEEDAINATVAKAEVRFERRYQSVQISAEEYSASRLGGNFLKAAS
jgi:hypothetical protein